MFTREVRAVDTDAYATECHARADIWRKAATGVLSDLLIESEVAATLSGEAIRNQP
jgi:hypothetical protein